jgi:hypothetical protein
VRWRSQSKCANLKQRSERPSRTGVVVDAEAAVPWTRTGARLCLSLERRMVNVCPVFGGGGDASRRMLSWFGDGDHRNRTQLGRCA